MDAYIDEVKFFSNELTQQQVTDLSNNNIPSTDYVPSDGEGIYKGTTLTQGYSGEWIQLIWVLLQTQPLIHLLLNHNKIPLLV